MQPTMLSFSEILVGLRDGKSAARHGWNRKGMYVKMQIPEENSKMRRSYLYIVPSEDGSETTPWQPSQYDLLTSDWYFI
jgi:hypothetical protein